MKKSSRSAATGQAKPQKNPPTTVYSIESGFSRISQLFILKKKKRPSSKLERSKNFGSLRIKSRGLTFLS